MLRIKGGERGAPGVVGVPLLGGQVSPKSWVTNLQEISTESEGKSGEKLGHLLFPLLTPGNQSSAFLSLWVSLQVCLFVTFHVNGIIQILSCMAFVSGFFHLT